MLDTQHRGVGDEFDRLRLDLLPRQRLLILSSRVYLPSLSAAATIALMSSLAFARWIASFNVSTTV
jgi:hypothetical protein